MQYNHTTMLQTPQPVITVEHPSISIQRSYPSLILSSVLLPCGSFKSSSPSSGILSPVRHETQRLSFPCPRARQQYLSPAASHPQRQWRQRKKKKTHSLSWDLIQLHICLCLWVQFVYAHRFCNCIRKNPMKHEGDCTQVVVYQWETQIFDLNECCLLSWVSALIWFHFLYILLCKRCKLSLNCTYCT